MSTSKSEVLKIFKALHRARLKVFKDDHEMLSVVRDGINTYFKENKSVNDPEKIKKLMGQAVTVEEEMRTRIFQAVEVKPGYHKVTITADHCVDDPGAAYWKKKGSK